MQFVQLAIVSTFWASVMAGYTSDFYEDTRVRPILLYECYRTGVTAEPEGAVNFTVLFDCTMEQGVQKCEASTSTAQSGHLQSYEKNVLEYTFDEASESLLLSSSDFSERINLPIKPYNGLACHFTMTITSDENREVYKLYDVESGCGNAAQLLSQLDLKGNGNFVFSRAVVQEVSQVCLKCARIDGIK